MRKAFFAACMITMMTLQTGAPVFADSLSDRYARAVTFAEAVFSPVVMIGGEPGKNESRDADIQSCISDDFSGEEIMIQGGSPHMATNVAVTDIVDDQYYLDVTTLLVGGDYDTHTERIIVAFNDDDKICRAEYNPDDTANRDFLAGQWNDEYSQRAFMTINRYAADDEYYCVIHWSGSYKEYAAWRFHITGTAGSSEFVYSDCEKVIVVSEEDGTETETVQYTSGSGKLKITGSGITWTDDMENAGDQCRFVKG